MKKRLISMVLVLAMMLGMVPMVEMKALARQTHYCNEPDTICGELPYAYRAMAVKSEDFFVTWANLYNADPYDDESLLPYDAEKFAELVDTSLATILKENCINPEMMTFTNVISAISTGSASDLASTEDEVYRALLWYMLTGVAERDIDKQLEEVGKITGDILTFLDTIVLWNGDMMPVRTFIQSKLVPKESFWDLFCGRSYKNQKLLPVKNGNTGTFDDDPLMTKLFEKLRKLFGISEDVDMKEAFGNIITFLQCLLEVAMETEERDTAISYILYIYSKVGLNYADVLDRMADHTENGILSSALEQLSSLIRSDDWKYALIDVVIENAKAITEMELGISEILMKARATTFSPYALLTGGMAVIEFFFGRSAQSQSAYVLLCTNEIDRAMVNTLEELDDNFRTYFMAERDQEAAAAASDYVTAALMCLRMLQKEYEFCANFFDAVYDTGLLTKVFRDHQEFRDWKSHIEYRTGFFKGIENNIFGPTTDTEGSWVRNRYHAHVELIEKGMKVVYNTDGGSGTFADQTKAYNLHMQLRSGTPEKEGMAFGGWKPTIEGREIPESDFWYNRGHTTISPGINPCYFADKIVLTAQWVEEEAIITYDANGGTDAPASHINTVGSTQLSLDMPTYTDHTFLGWAEDPEAIAASYGAGGLLPAEKEGAITLYAVWEANLVHITYNYEDDTSGQTPTCTQEIFDRSKETSYYVQSPEEGKETYNGSSFIGWMMKDPDGDLWWADGTIDNGRYTLVQPKAYMQPIRDIEFHAKWKWFLHYDYGNDLYIHDSAADGEEIVLPEPVHRKEGYAFGGWMVIGGDQSGVYYPGNTITVTGDLQLYAYWTERDFDLEGKVCDNAGNPLSDAIVQVFDAGGNSVGAVLTDSTGSYTFHFAKAGTYSRVFHKIGYASRTVDGLVVDERLDDLGEIRLSEGVSDITDGGRCGLQAAWVMDKNNGLHIIGSGPMFECSYYERPWDAYRNTLTSITVCEGITRIGDYAFRSMRGQLTLPETLISIGEGAFFDYQPIGFSPSLKNGELVLPQRLETIGKEAFYSHSFRRIKIGRNVSKIGYFKVGDNVLEEEGNPFGEGLAAIDVDPANRTYASEDGVLYTKDRTKLLIYPPMRQSESLILPEQTAEISSYAFNEWWEYPDLKHIGISAVMSDIEYSVLDRASIEEFTVSARNPNYCAVDGVVFSKDKKTLVLYPNARKEPRYQVPEGTETIGTLAFSGCSRLITIDLPRSLTTIKSSAVFGCPLLYNLVIPKTVTTIEDYAFNGYSDESVFDLYFMGDVPENFGAYIVSENSEDPVTLYYPRGAEGWTSPTWTFNYATYHTAPFNPSTLDLSVIEQGTMDNGLQWTIDRDGTLTISGRGPMEDEVYTVRSWLENVREGLDQAIQKVVISDGITRVGGLSFCNMDSLKTVEIGDTVTEIGWSAFSDCAALVDIALPAQLKTVGNCAFAGCTALTDLDLPDGVETLGGWVFERCTALKEISLPNSVKSMDVSVFENCIELQTATLPEGLESIPDGLFAGCKKLESIDIPDTVKRLGSQAFEECCTLTSVVLPSSIQYIPRAAFKGCSSLTSVAFLNEWLRQIQEYAFSGCSSLTSIVIPKGVNQINEYAFTGADQLNAIYFLGDVPSIMEEQALGSQRDATIYYIAGAEGWISPMWTVPNSGEVFKTTTWKPRPSTPVQEILVPTNDKKVVITIDASADDIRKVLVGAYVPDSEQLISAAIGIYDGSSNTVSVAFDMPLPEHYALRVFCTDDNFAPLYKVSSFAMD